MADNDPLAGIPPFQPNESAMAAIMARWRQRGDHVIDVGAGSLNFTGRTASVTLIASQGDSASVEAVKIPGSPAEETEKPLIELPEILLQAAVVTFGDKTNEGRLIEAVAIPWFEIIRQIERDPDFMFKVPWRKLEEIIAGAFNRYGYPDVILTPRSGDGGRDIIATRPGVGSLRIWGQSKAYAPDNLVTAEEVRAMLGILSGENVSKGMVMTTSDFAPRLHEDEHIRKFLPYRLELMNGQRLFDWLTGLLPKQP